MSLKKWFKSKDSPIFKDLKIQRTIISHNLYKIYEGSTLSYADYDPEKLKSFIPFAIDSEGGVTSLFYPSNMKTKTGDIVIDCRFTKLFYE